MKFLRRKDAYYMRVSIANKIHQQNPDEAIRILELGAITNDRFGMVIGWIENKCKWYILDNCPCGNLRPDDWAMSQRYGFFSY